MKKPFVTLKQLEAMAGRFPTPFHLYDERGIRENARELKAAFAWNPGFREYFAVKATPTPAILNILREEGCGADCSSLTELMMSDRCGFSGSEIMFSSNDTPPEEFELAAKLGATINLDDFTHIDFLKKPLDLFQRPFPAALIPVDYFPSVHRKRAFRLWTTLVIPNTGLPENSCLRGLRS